MLESIHARHVVNGDFKLSNVLIDNDGYLVLTDWGLASFNGHGGPRGTYLFMPPEVLLGRERTNAVDWYSLGCIAHKFYTGMLPYEGDDNSLEALQKRVAVESVRWHRGFRPIAFCFVESLLDKDPVRRLGSGGAEEVMAHPFFHGFDWESLREGRMPGLPDFG